MAKDAVIFIKALGYSKVNLLGFSMGGFIAQQIALDEPQLVNKIILAGTGQKGSTGLTEIVKPLTAASKMGPEKQKLYLFYSPSAILEKKYSKGSIAARSIVIQTLQTTALWPNYMLSLIGRNHIMVPTINSYMMFQHISNSKLILYPDSGHGFLFQYPEEFVKDVTAFLDQA